MEVAVKHVHAKCCHEGPTKHTSPNTQAHTHTCPTPQELLPALGLPLALPSRLGRLASRHAAWPLSPLLERCVQPVTPQQMPLPVARHGGVQQTRDALGRSPSRPSLLPPQKGRECVGLSTARHTVSGTGVRGLGRCNCGIDCGQVEPI